MFSSSENLRNVFSKKECHIYREVLACGTPVVATAVGGISTDRRVFSRSLIPPPDDADAMAAQIVRLLEDDGLRQKMSGRAAEDAKKRFDLRRQVEEYVE